MLGRPIDVARETTLLEIVTTPYIKIVATEVTGNWGSSLKVREKKLPNGNDAVLRTRFGKKSAQPRVKVAEERTERDSNPRYSCEHAGFQNRCVKPDSAIRPLGR